MPFDVDVVSPVHNEAESIASTLREFHERVAVRAGFDLRFIICEDGSTDGSVQVLQSLSEDLPIRLITGSERKGYSRAVVDGFRNSTASVVGFIDSDGQCDPDDFPRLADAMTDDCDLVLGYRQPRADHWVRLAMSASFKLVYERLFPVRVVDPSCPYLLIRRPMLERVLSGKLPLLAQGFWWEFVARAHEHGARIREVPVRHRSRAAGWTQVYRPSRVPGIAASHLRGLFELRRELRSSVKSARPR
jgi:dolichol-phosphate mannosyltransferase